jgi:hypothetical protein
MSQHAVLRAKCPVVDQGFDSVSPADGGRRQSDANGVRRHQPDAVRSAAARLPETDTPPVLKAYTEKFSVQPGWYFLTGKKDNVEWVL